MPQRYRFGRVEVRPAERRVLVGGTPAALGGRAFDVLVALIERRDRVVGKDELLELAWPGLVVEENNLQVQVSTLRRILGPDAIATVSGHGYRFTLEPDALADATPAGPAGRRHRLPAPLTRFIGRAREKREVAALFGVSPLVTLTGFSVSLLTSAGAILLLRLWVRRFSVAWFALYLLPLGAILLIAS